MVLGMKSKHKKGVPIKVSYIVQLQQIKPWPPFESLRSVQTVLLQWENGNNNCGSFLSVAGDSNIVFNESFMLSSALYRKSSGKFRKNYLEFSLYEPRKDKVKGQILGTASVNIAEYGLLEGTVSVDAPMNFKKISGNTMQPFLAISLEPVERDSPNSSPNLSKDGFMNYDDDDSERASWTDDDTSSHSSRATGSYTFDAASASASPSLNEKNDYGNGGIEQRSRNVWSSSTDASPDRAWKSKANSRVALSKFAERSMSYIPKNSVNSAAIGSSPSSISFRDVNGRFNNIVASSLPESLSHDLISNIRHKTSRRNQQSVEERSAPDVLSADHYRINYSSSDSISAGKKWQQEVLIDDALSGLLTVKEKDGGKDTALGKHLVEGTKTLQEKRLHRKWSEAASKIQVMAKSDTIVPDRKGLAVPPSSNNKATLKHAKPGMYSTGKPQDLDIPNCSSNKGKLNAESERELAKSNISDSSEWRMKAEMLVEELREAAVIEVSLYSIVAEHSSSANKVHAPARRLSRFYTIASQAGPQFKRASAARAAVSGLVLVSKACGSDVPRLTFWLSNSIMLRAIVTQRAAELPHTNGEETDDWEDVMTFIIALEKVESWLFSRIVESVWWQTFTPHMQPTTGKSSSRNKGTGTKKTTGKRTSLGNHERDNLSMELWKKAFKDACERLCPIRAAGHECGCLSQLVILVMEQLVNRLDVAMFNAILRESTEEMPTDPISDPISDAKVLPVPPGKSSFTAGAQLKNAIGNWSRWLTDLFGLEDDSTEDNGVHGEGKGMKSFKAFRLLHTLSDLMMIPFGILVDDSTRKEVCPTFGPTIIRRVLNNFVPDEFCPEPIPRSILNTLNSEENTEQSEAMLTSLPCIASPTKYSPPPAALLTCVGDVGSQVLKSSILSTLKKSYASDDELDELDTPLTSIIPDSYKGSSALARLSLMPKEKGGGNVLRYHLLREIWVDEEL